MSHKKQVVLITGASSGFGKLMALMLARNEFSVFASMRGSIGKNASAAEEFRAVAAKEALALEPCEMDVTDEASVNECITGVIAKAGRLDVLINNAGFGYNGLTETFTLEQTRAFLRRTYLAYNERFARRCRRCSSRKVGSCYR